MARRTITITQHRVAASAVTLLLWFAAGPPTWRQTLVGSRRLVAGIGRGVFSGGVRHLVATVQAAATVASVTLMLFFALGPHLLNYRPLDVLSGSMAPDFPTGSEVIDTSIPTARLRVGDVLTYHIPVYDHHVESHRVIKITPFGAGRWLIQTKGDHNNAADPWVADIASPRVWIARFDVPLVGTWLHDARSHLTLRMFQWIVPMLALSWMLLGIWRDETIGAESSSDVVEAAGA